MFIFFNNIFLGAAVCKQLCQLKMTVIAAGPRPFSEVTLTPEMQTYIERGKLIYIHLRLDSFQSIENAVKVFSSKYDSLNYLINNAAVMLAPYFETEEGFEGHMGVNFIGHVKLTKLLLPKLNNGQCSRIINVASSAHKIAPVSLLLSGKYFVAPIPFYCPHFSYALSKLATILYTECLASQLKQLNSSIRVYSVHPGIVASSLYRHVCLPLRCVHQFLSLLFYRTVDEGALPILNCAVSDDIVQSNGCYIQDGSGSYLSYVTESEKLKFWQTVGQHIYNYKLGTKKKE